MEFVIIANAKSKGVTGITINEGSSKNDLYNQLVYTYAGKDWSENIPMWGTATLAHITEGTWNVGEVTLKRAIVDCVSVRITNRLRYSRVRPE